MSCDTALGYTDTMDTKTCTKCKRDLPNTAEYFAIDRSKRSGLTPNCKQCRAEKTASWRKANPDKAAEGWRRYQSEHGAEKSAKAHARRAQDPEHFRAIERAYEERSRRSRRARGDSPGTPRVANRSGPKRCARCGELLPADKFYRRRDGGLSSYCRPCYADWRREWRASRPSYHSDWHKAHPEVGRAKNHRRMAIIAAAVGNHTAADIRDLLSAQVRRCAYCDGDLTMLGYHVDHVVPLSRGGSNARDNLAASCPACNMAKGDKLFSEWLA